MRGISLIAAMAALAIAGGCDNRTPEEIEAARYPQLEPNSPEQSAEAQRLLQPGDQRTGAQ